MLAVVVVVEKCLSFEVREDFSQRVQVSFLWAERCDHQVLLKSRYQILDVAKMKKGLND